jgi:hypothetical protein
MLLIGIAGQAAAYLRIRLITPQDGRQAAEGGKNGGDCRHQSEDGSGWCRCAEAVDRFSWRPVCDWIDVCGGLNHQGIRDCSMPRPAWPVRRIRWRRGRQVPELVSYPSFVVVAQVRHPAYAVNFLMRYRTHRPCVFPLLNDGLCRLQKRKGLKLRWIAT